MRTDKLFLIVFIVLFSLNPMTLRAESNSPMGAIRLTVDSVLDVLKDKTLAAPDKKEARRSRLRSLIRERFDFKEMSKRTLARHWRERTPEEMEEFVRIFSDLLIDSYIGKIEAYTDEKVMYDKEEIKGKGKYGVVDTKIISKDVDIPIEYKVILKGDKWWVYDVIVEGVSFISTYRSQYDKVIVGDSYAKLLEKMKKKLDEINAM